MPGRRARPPRAVAVASLADTGDAATDRVLIQAEQNLQDLQDHQRALAADVATLKADARVFGTAPPTTGRHELAALIWNSSPTSGGFIGWVCTAAGSPGTWKTWGPIS